MDNTKNPHVPGPGGGKHPNGEPNTTPLVPDIALQSNIAIPAAARKAFVDDLEAQLKKVFPHAKVFAAPDNMRFGVFVDNSLTSSDAVKQQGTDAIELTVTGRGIAFTIKIDANFMIRETDKAFTKVPQAFDTDGKPDKDGSIVIQSLHLDFLSAHAVSAVITGVVNVGPFSDGWTAKASDTLETTSKDTLHVVQHNKFSPDQPLTDVLKFFAEVIFKWFGGLFFIDPIKNPNPDVLSAVHPTAQLIGMLPPQVLLPGGDQKVVLTYHSGGVDLTGVAVHGTLEVTARHPKVAIETTGSTKVLAFETIAAAAIGMTTTDLRPPLKIQWTAEDGTVKAPHGSGESVTFEIGAQKAGAALERTVSVSVTDADQITRHASKAIAIDVVAPTKPTGHGPDSSHEPTHTNTPKAPSPPD